MSGHLTRHEIITPSQLRAHHERPIENETLRSLMRPRRLLKRVPFIKGEQRSYRRYTYEDKHPYLWNLMYKDVLLFNTQTDDFQTMNTELFFIHDKKNMCDMTEWGDDTEDCLFLCKDGNGDQITRVISVTQPMVYADDTGMFHCAKCNQPFGYITDLAVGRDREDKATIVFNIKRWRYIDIIDPLLDLEAYRVGKKLREARAGHTQEAEMHNEEEEEKTNFHDIVLQGELRQLKEYKDRFVIDELKALFEQANLADD